MNHRRLILFLSCAIVLGLSTGLLLASCIKPPTTLKQMLNQVAEVNRKNHVNNPTGVKIHVEMMYEALSFEQMSNRASAIFIGKVTNISPSQWNQDSGEYWYDPKADFELLLHHVEVDVVQSIVDPINLGPHVEITVLAESQIVDEKGVFASDNEKAHDLMAGQQVVFFVRQTEIAWRGGTRKALTLMGAPFDSYFRMEQDGLYHGHLIKEPLAMNNLIDRIKAARTALASP